MTNDYKVLEPYDIVLVYTPKEDTENSVNSEVEHTFLVYAYSPADAVRGLKQLFAGVTIIAIIFGSESPP
jgi:hypothetical protein